MVGIETTSAAVVLRLCEQVLATRARFLFGSKGTSVKIQSVIILLGCRCGNHAEVQVLGVAFNKLFGNLDSILYAAN